MSQTKIYFKEYHQRPEVKAKAKVYNKLPAVKARAAERAKIYFKRSDIKARRQSPEFKAYHREYFLLRNYGLTIDDKEALLAKQGGRCATCGTDKFNGTGPCVDHNHVTGKIRGILCHDCNRAIGLVRESIPTLRLIIEYLH